jgi:hypothetical protein
VGEIEIICGQQADYAGFYNIFINSLINLLPRREVNVSLLEYGLDSVLVF